MFPNYVCQKYFTKKKFSLALTSIFCILGWGRGQDKTEKYCLFFLPKAIFCFCFTTNFGRLYSSVWALLEERSGTAISVLTGIDFRTEGLQYPEFFFLQLFFSVWKLLSLSIYSLYRSIKTEGNLKLVFGWYLPINQSGQKTRKPLYSSAHVRRGYWLRLHHQ